MKKKLVFIVVSVMLLLCLTVNAMAINVGTFEYGNLPFSSFTNKKLIVSPCNGTMIKTLRNVTKRAYFDGVHPLHLCYSQSYSGTVGINTGVELEIPDVAKVSVNYSFSWTAGEVSAYTWDINKGDKVGYYNIRYNKSFKKYPYKYYTRKRSVFEPENWTLKESGTLLDGAGTGAPYFMLGYSAN